MGLGIFPASLVRDKLHFSKLQDINVMEQDLLGIYFEMVKFFGQ
jgi:hypothetical protein